VETALKGGFVREEKPEKNTQKSVRGALP